ncbi:MAG TPA: molybdopterin cofactor-binding domain-containing protein [Solirubrobacteraceae bacterium]|nr:molybdopterin cofactor-binding domain-containing protein [Solirubrobacteraceae bacterium]
MAVPATASPALGSRAQRLEAREKVTGAARYAYEHPREDAAYGWIIGATIARGTIRSIDAGPALAAPGVIAILTHENAPELQPVPDGELSILQSPEVSYRGQIIGAVVAETLEAAREAAALVRIGYDDGGHDVMLTPQHPKLYKPDVVNPRFPTDTEQGDCDAAFAQAAVQLDATYTTAATHNNPMEPHATMAVWDGGALTLYDSTQGAPSARESVAKVLGLDPQQVRVISPHVGGGFGSKGTPRPHVVLAALCAKVTDRPVKLAVTRQQMFDLGLVTGCATRPSSPASASWRSRRPGPMPGSVPTRSATSGPRGSTPPAASSTSTTRSGESGATGRSST